MVRGAGYATAPTLRPGMAAAIHAVVLGYLLSSMTASAVLGVESKQGGREMQRWGGMLGGQSQ